MSDDEQILLLDFISRYCANVREGFFTRWQKHTPEIYENGVSEVIGGLTARQATLAVEIASNPGIWNANIAPIILRAMTDVHITLAWIVDDPALRSKDYVRYGLGQEKLFLEYLQNEADQIPEGEIDDSLEDVISKRKLWLNSQIMDWALEINVGSWSGKSTREMAQQAKCESLYKFSYVPFSGATHSMWQHVGMFNMSPCKNPLHKNHSIPIIVELDPDPDYLFRSAKYVSRSYSLITEKMGLETDVLLPAIFFLEQHPFKSKNIGDDE